MSAKVTHYHIDSNIRSDAMYRRNAVCCSPELRRFSDYFSPFFALLQTAFCRRLAVGLCTKKGANYGRKALILYAANAA